MTRRPPTIRSIAVLAPLFVAGGLALTAVPAGASGATPVLSPADAAAGAATDTTVDQALTDAAVTGTPSGAEVPAAVQARAVTGGTPTVKVRTLALGSVGRPTRAARVERRQPAGVPINAEARRKAPTATPEGVLRATAVESAPFSAVGVTWRQDDALGPVSIAFRTRATGAGWTPWTTGAGDERDPGGTPVAARARLRGGSDLVWTGSARAVEVVVTSLTGRRPTDIRLDLIDPGHGAVDSAASMQPVAALGTSMPAASDVGDGVARAAVATTEMRTAATTEVQTVATTVVPSVPYGNGVTRIYSRAAWGADPSWMTWPPQSASRLSAVVVHHTAGTNSYTPEEVPGILRSIYRYQAISLGWGDIGYNVLVDKYGRTWEGRAGGITRRITGAHAGGFNTGTAGVALLGDFTGTEPDYKGKSSVARYAAFVLGSNGVNPLGTTKLTGGPSTKYPANTTLTLPTIFPHKSTSATACPGAYLEKYLGWMRTSARDLIALYKIKP